MSDIKADEKVFFYHASKSPTFGIKTEIKPFKMTCGKD